MKKAHIAFLIGTLIGGAALPVSTFAQSTAKTKATTAPASTAPTAAEIADAKAKGLVWVNTSTKVYHKSDDKFYGATKKGKFMTEADAQAAGNKLSGTSSTSKKKKSTTK